MLIFTSVKGLKVGKLQGGRFIHAEKYKYFVIVTQVNLW